MANNTPGMEVSRKEVRGLARNIRQQLYKQSGLKDSKEEKRNRYDFGTFLLMLVVALFFDGVQFLINFIPFVGWLISPLISLFAWLSFYVWTSIKGWGLSDTMKQIIVQWAIPIFEFIPLLNTLPTWTLKIVLTAAFLKSEDLIYNTTHGKIELK